MPATGSRIGIGTFKRSYPARLILKENGFSEVKMNPLNLMISPEDAPCVKKASDDDTFVCAVHVKRQNDALMNSYEHAVSPAMSSTSASLASSEASSPAHKHNKKTGLTNFTLSEDLIVCVWVDPSDSDNTSQRSFSLDRSISIDDDDDSSDNSSDDTQCLQLHCTNKFLSHYSLTVNDNIYIRAINVYPLHKAIFSVSDEEFYKWLQLGKFSAGLLKEICTHDLLVTQNDVLLAPFPEIFLQDENFRRSWYFHIKAIACAPLKMGLITAETEIVIYFEKAISRLPSDHRHLSGSHLDQYVDLHTSTTLHTSSNVMFSDFCRTLSTDSLDSTFKSSEPEDDSFFLSSAFVIQQKIHWKKVLYHDENFETLDLTTVLGMPKKIMQQNRILNGTILKIALFPGDGFGNPSQSLADAKSFLRKEKPKQKFVKVQCLSSKLDESDVVFLSSMLLFNLQKGPPIIKSPLLIIEVLCYFICC